jgi:hypothetical protein
LTEKKHGRAAKRNPFSAVTFGELSASFTGGSVQAEWRANQAESLIKKYPKSNGSADDAEGKPNEPDTLTPFPDGWLTVPDLTPDPSVLMKDKSADSPTHAGHTSDPQADRPDAPVDLAVQPDCEPTHSDTVLTMDTGSPAHS